MTQFLKLMNECSNRENTLSQLQIDEFRGMRREIEDANHKLHEILSNAPPVIDWGYKLDSLGVSGKPHRKQRTIARASSRISDQIEVQITN